MVRAGRGRCRPCPRSRAATLRRPLALSRAPPSPLLRSSGVVPGRGSLPPQRQLCRPRSGGGDPPSRKGWHRPQTRDSPRQVSSEQTEAEGPSFPGTTHGTRPPGSRGRERVSLPGPPPRCRRGPTKSSRNSRTILPILSFYQTRNGRGPGDPPAAPSPPLLCPQLLTAPLAHPTPSGNEALCPRGPAPTPGNRSLTLPAPAQACTRVRQWPHTTGSTRGSPGGHSAAASLPQGSEAASASRQ